MRARLSRPGRADREHPLRRLAHLDDAVAERLGRDEVQMRQLGDGVAHGVVDRAFGNLAAMDVRDRNAHQRGRGRGRQAFRNGRRAATTMSGWSRLNALGKVRRLPSPLDVAISTGASLVRLHGHFGIDREAVLPDQIDRVAERRLQMHRRRHDLQLDLRILPDRAHEPVEQPVFGARSGDDTDAARHLGSGLEDVADETHGRDRFIERYRAVALPAHAHSRPAPPAAGSPA